MFYDCSSLSTLSDISKWDIKNVNNMSYMFYNCHSLSPIKYISKWKNKNNISMDNIYNNYNKCINLIYTSIFILFLTYFIIFLSIIITSFQLPLFLFIYFFVFLFYPYKIKSYINIPSYNIIFTKINDNIEFQSDKKKIIILICLLFSFITLHFFNSSFYIIKINKINIILSYLLTIITIINDLLIIKIFFRLNNSFEKFEVIINRQLKPENYEDFGRFNIHIFYIYNNIILQFIFIYIIIIITNTDIIINSKNKKIISNIFNFRNENLNNDSDDINDTSFELPDIDILKYEQEKNEFNFKLLNISD